MERRAYLGVVLAGAVAGCGDIVPDEDDAIEETNGGVEEEDSEGDVPADEEEPDEQDEAEGDGEEESEADESEEEEQELTEDERVAEQRIAAGDELLGEAVRTYSGGDSIGTLETNGDESGSILNVRASRTRFRWVPVANRIREANQRFDSAHGRANEDQRARIQNLRDVGAFLRESARLQAVLGEAFEAFEGVLIAHQGDSLSTAAWNRFRDRFDRLAPRLSAVRDVTDPDAAAASDNISTETVQEKLDQFETEHDALGRVVDARRPFMDGHRAWLDAEQAYRSRSWSRASNQFAIVREQFGTAADRLDGDPVGDDRFDGRYRTFFLIARTLADAAVEYEASADTYREWDRGGRDRDRLREEADEYRRAGRRILRDEDAVTDIPSVRRVENYSGPT